MECEMSDSRDIEKWFSDPKHGNEMQDMDLILANVQLLPRLKRYLDDPDASTGKMSTVISALLEILEHDCPHDGGQEAADRAEDIKNTIRLHADAAKDAIPELGLVKAAVVRIILGLPVSSEWPQWVIDQANHEAWT